MSMLTAVTASDLAQQITSLYQRGMPRGASTGWPSVDHHYTVIPGQLTVVTGIPGMGKSEWLDALSVNLTFSGWKFVVFSPENQPHELHLSKLMEKFVQKPFGKHPERMDTEELALASCALDVCYRFLKTNTEFAATPSLQSVIHAASLEFQKWIDDGEEKLGLIIDPWNEMDHGRPSGFSETEYISQALSMIRQFGRDWNVHVWLVAHPAKLLKDKEGKYPVPSLYDISGSAHWRNKADNGIVIHRNVMDGTSAVEVHVQKVRFKNVGSPGVANLFYNRNTGCYQDFVGHEVQRYAANDVEVAL